jgi:hypothetical protein
MSLRRKPEKQPQSGMDGVLPKTMKMQPQILRYAQDDNPEEQGK